MSSIQSYIEGGTTIIKSYIVFRVTTATISGGVQEVVAGTNVTVDNTDPTRPIVSATGGGGGSSVWGGITGTLSNQTDLQNALNAKANLIDPIVYAIALG